MSTRKTILSRIGNGGTPISLSDWTSWPGHTNLLWRAFPELRELGIKVMRFQGGSPGLVKGNRLLQPLRGNPQDVKDLNDFITKKSGSDYDFDGLRVSHKDALRQYEAEKKKRMPSEEEWDEQCRGPWDHMMKPKHSVVIERR